MPPFVALLRGVNVGKAKRVAMADVRRIVQDLGCTEVTTLLNSGNVVFQHPKTPSAKVAAKLAVGLADQLKILVPVVVKSSSEFVAILNENPLCTPGCRSLAVARRVYSGVEGPHRPHFDGSASVTS